MSDHTLPFPDEFLLSAYSDRTLAMLRRYNRSAIELGRLPSLLGREFFRAKVTSYTVHTFEDAIIFAFDMERSLSRLTPAEQTLIARLVFQEYTQDEVARRVRLSRSNIAEKFVDAVDHLTEILLSDGLLNPTILEPRYKRRPQVPQSQDSEVAVDNGSKPSVVIELKACQEPKTDALAASA